jgi:hydroxyethylthiazole kinase-like uncharacterized protein yjeF
MKQLDELLATCPLPDASGGKDAKGNTMIIGGPPSCPGAVLLAATASLRVGSGRVQLVVHPEVAPGVATALPEGMVLGWDQRAPLSDGVTQQLAKAGVVVVGSGCSELEPDAVAMVADATDAHLVLDAGALPVALELSKRARVTIAPNPDEGERLLDRTGSEAVLAPMLADALGSAVAVRGETTVVAHDDECWVFDDAPPGLGTPGSGDVFVGVLGGLLACGLDDLGALAWATAIHAHAGALLAAATPIGYLASEIAAQIPRARAELATGARTRAGDAST